MAKKQQAILLAILAAALYAVNVPVSRLLLAQLPAPRFWPAPVIMATVTVVMVRDTLKGE